MRRFHLFSRSQHALPFHAALIQGALRQHGIFQVEDDRLTDLPQDSRLIGIDAANGDIYGHMSPDEEPKCFGTLTELVVSRSTSDAIVRGAWFKIDPADDGIYTGLRAPPSGDDAEATIHALDIQQIMNRVTLGQPVFLTTASMTALLLGALATAIHNEHVTIHRLLPNLRQTEHTRT